MKKLFVTFFILINCIFTEEFTFKGYIFPDYISKDFLQKLPDIFVI